MNQNEIPSHYKCKANKGELGFMVMNAISVRRGLQVNRLEFKFRRYKLDLGEKIPGFNGYESFIRYTIYNTASICRDICERKR